MRFDLVSVFPEFFSVLDLSLVGKARQRGIVDLNSHDLRDWTHDVHRTVDDTPAGGGAGMVMKPDVWAAAIDSILADADDSSAIGEASEATLRRTVLAIPTPSGTPLTQAMCADLAGADHVIVACGRYEGIDARVAEYYAETIEVVEYSLGDYVLNGGEVAAIALVEAVSRLLPGMVGNPESLVEESHGAAGLLEYPVYTRPVEFRGHDIPDVLMGGNHGAVERWRRDQALTRTATRRPDMIARLDASSLDKKDRRKLLDHDWVVPEGSEHPSRLDTTVDGLGVSFASESTLAERSRALAHLAATTFPDACPPDVSAADIEAFIAANLTEARFRDYLTGDDSLVVALWCEGTPIGYSLVLFPTDDDVRGRDDGAPADFVDGTDRDGPLVNLSKLYLLREWRGSGVAEKLVRETLGAIAASTSSSKNPYVWLGTNPGNRRAVKFYEKMKFKKTGTREFVVGDQINHDVTLARAVNLAE